MKELKNIKKVILILIIGVSLAACGTETKDTQSDSSEAVESDVKSIEEDTEGEGDNSSNEDQLDSNDNQENPAEDASITEGESSKDETVESSLSQEEANDKAFVEKLLETNEYSAIDLKEPDDLTSYVSGLVFILQEDDIWRVVDRLGKIYRISTSHVGLVQGVVNNGAIVATDSDEKVNVSLGKEYTSFENSNILNASVDDVAKEFSEKLLLQQIESDEKSKISSYTLNSAEVIEKTGKGILTIKMNFDVKPEKNASLWGDTDVNGFVTNIDYTYTLYGYDGTWILPIKKPLYLDYYLKYIASGNTNDAAATVSNTDKDNAGNLNTFLASENQTVLSRLDETYLYMEKVTLSQNDEYEMKLYTYNSGNENVVGVTDGLTNGNYEVITSFGNKVYLYVIETSPSAEDIISGVAVVDMGNDTYRNLYVGRIEKGDTLKDKSYIFTNENLIEINLITNSLRIVAVLPKHLDFDNNSVKVIDVTGGLMNVEISYDEESVTYSIDLVTGEMIITGNFKY